MRPIRERADLRDVLLGFPPGGMHDFGHDRVGASAARVLVNRRWRSGTATVLPEDDPGQRSRTLPYRWDAAIGRAMATTPLTVRIDLRRAAGEQATVGGGP